MNDNVVERFFRRGYDEQEGDCKLIRHTVWTPSLTGEGIAAEDAVRAGEGLH